jgi:hypothetical protein
MVIRHVNNTNPVNLPDVNYTNYGNAISNANNNDIIKIWSNGINIVTFTYKQNIVQSQEITNYSDNMGKFLYTLLNSNNTTINNIRANRNIYLNYYNNKFKLGTITNTNKTLVGSGDFKGSSITLDTTINPLPTNKSLLVGISEKLAYPTKDQDIGFYVKYIDNTNFDPADTVGQNISILPLSSANNINFKINLPNYLDDINKSTFTNKLLNLGINEKFSRPLNLKVIKNFTKNFNLQLPKDGIFMLLDPGRYAEYAINLTSLIQTKNSSNNFHLDKRSGRELYNGNASVRKGPFNGWRFNKTTGNYINWTLYDRNLDTDISSQTLNYFWFTIYQPTNIAQTIYLDIINPNNYVQTLGITTPAQSGRYLLWYSPNLSQQPTNSTFEHIIGTETAIQFSSSQIDNIIKARIRTDINDMIILYIEAYGYSTPTSMLNLALRKITDTRLTDSKQISLSTQSGYNLLFSKFINTDQNSSYPMDVIDSDTTNAITEETARGSIGWYFDSTKNLSLNLMSTSNINSILNRTATNSLTYNDFHTMFVEVNIKEHTNFTISAFGKTSIPINDMGQKIIYFKNSPFTPEPYVVPPTTSFITNLIPANPSIQYTGVDVGTHKYRVTFFTDVGETLSGPNDYTSTIQVLAGQGNVIISSLPISDDPRVKGRKIYRTTANDSLSVYKFVLQLFDNTTLTVTDSIPDYQLGATLPTTNTASSGTLEVPQGGYFSQLNPNVINSLDNYSLFIDSNINTTDSFINLIVNAANNTDIEILSYGYKLRGYPPIHMQTRWSTLDNSPLISNVNGFLTIEKDAFSIASAQDTIVDSKFKVIAYGDFIKGNYLQNPLSGEYADIRVNIEVNKAAVQNALFYLDSADMNNYTIKIDGLEYMSNGVAITDANGNIKTNYVTFGNTKYIMGDLTIDNNIESTYINTVNNMKIFVRNGGLTPVLLQGVYAAIFKAFNKSGSILNPSLLSSVNNLASEVLKPNVPAAQLASDESNNLELGGVYSYRITYYTNTGETECSLESNYVTQSTTNKKKILITLPISQDIRVLGRKIYRRKVISALTSHLYIVSVANNIDTLFLDDILEPTNTTVSRPSLAYLTANDSSYSVLTAARLMDVTQSILSPNISYQYKITYYNVTDNIVLETLPSDASTPIIMLPVSCKIIVNIPICPNNTITGRRIYRTINGGNTFVLIGVIPDNVTSLYIDNVSDSMVDITTIAPTVSTLPSINTPLLTSVGGNAFTYLYTKIISMNLLTNGSYIYKFTFIVSNTVNGTTILGETDASDQSNTIYQSIDSASKILLNLPISTSQNVIGRNIYRTNASGNIFRFLTTINDNSTTIYFDNIPDKNLGVIIPLNNTTNITAPIINTTKSAAGNIDPLNYLLANSFNEVNVPAYQSNIFKLYNYSGRFAQDQLIYSSNTNNTVGNSVNGINSSGIAIPNGTQIYNTVNMNLENMELNIRCKLRGALYNVANNNALIKTPLTKAIAEFIFGKYNNSINGIVSEPSTLVRQVTRVGSNTFGLDELGVQMDMMNNDKNNDGTYKVTNEMQYEIIFIIGLIQRVS